MLLHFITLLVSVRTFEQFKIHFWVSKPVNMAQDCSCIVKITAKAVCLCKNPWTVNLRYDQGDRPLKYCSVPAFIASSHLWSLLRLSTLWSLVQGNIDYSKSFSYFQTFSSLYCQASYIAWQDSLSYWKHSKLFCTFRMSSFHQFQDFVLQQACLMQEEIDYLQQRIVVASFAICSMTVFPNLICKNFSIV